MGSEHKHTFALYVDHLDLQDDRVTLSDAALIQRISKVLRLRSGDELILFDGHNAATVRIDAVSRHMVSTHIVSHWRVRPLRPEIQWYVPLMAKQAFEDAISTLTVLGVRHIYPIRTEKSHKQWGEPRDFQRIRRVMIAAAEQAKQFAIPNVHHPSDLDTVPLIADTTFVCDPAGEPISRYISSFFNADIHTTYAGIVGPEGGLTPHETAYLQQLGVHSLRLTPTTLKAETAVTVAAGSMRMLLTNGHKHDAA